MSGIGQEALGLQKVPEPWSEPGMKNIYQAGVLVNHEAKLKGGCEGE